LTGALEGVAQGLHPEYIGLALPATSLQLIGTGVSYLDFYWIPEQLASAASVNEQQLFLPVGLNMQTGDNGPDQFNSLKINSMDEVSWRVFPNPAREYIQLDINMAISDQPLVIVLTNTQGQRVKQLNLDQASMQLRMNVVDLPAGNYFLTLDTPTARYTQMIILE
jgi:hypothetical protein